MLLTNAELVSHAVCNHQVVLIDFGKATPVNSGRLYHLSDGERQQHSRRHTHLAPEVLHGLAKQTRASDVYSIGMLLSKIINCSCFSQLSSTQTDALLALCTSCKATEPQLRPSAKQCSQKIKDILAEQQD